MTERQTRPKLQNNGTEHDGTTETLDTAAPPPARASWTRYLVQFLLLVLLVIGAVFGHQYWQYASVHISTDDAELNNDVIQIAPQVSGTILRVCVQDNQLVKKGDLLAQLDDATYQATLDQAKANLTAAIAQAQGAGVSVNLASETGDAQLTQAQGIVAQASSSIAGAHADVAKATMAVIQAQAAAKGAESNISTMQAALLAAQANKQKAVAALADARAQVATAQSTVRAQEANVTAAKATAEKTASDEARYKSLLAQDAISQQTVDQATAAAISAKAQVEVAQQQVEAAREQVDARKADVESATEQVSAAEAMIAQAKAQIDTAREQLTASNAAIDQAKAAGDSVKESVHLAQARYTQAQGQLHQAHTLPRQVAVSKSNHAQALAKIEQARAALESAQIQLNYTRIYAPSDGQISKKTAEVGALVQAGTPLMAIVPQNNIWVVANYKETQLTDVKEGQHAEIDVDALPGRHFTGKVDSINAATGGTFALLPPDNATGNYTKVVQRIPVKIVLDPPGQPDIDRLRAGMSVTATIAIR